MIASAAPVRLVTLVCHNGDIVPRFDTIEAAARVAGSAQRGVTYRARRRGAAVARYVGMAKDAYKRDAAAFLLSRLEACSGVVSRDVEAFKVSHDRARGAVLGTVRIVESDYPEWYREATRAGFDGAEIRAVLVALAGECAPNMGRREARYFVEAIEAARETGDRKLDLPPMDGRRDESAGGAKRGRKQAVLAADGERVARFPLRVRAATLATMREQAARRGVTLNAHISAILADVASRGADPESEPF